MVKQFTGKGDDGTTGLLNSDRLSKADAVIEAIGTLDELSSFLGNAKSLIGEGSIHQSLENIQRDLYLVMAELASTNENRLMSSPLSEARVLYLEELIDQQGKSIEMPKGFILPGETREAAVFGICRSVCRRAERRVVEVKEQGKIANPQVLRYLNRLSSMLFLFEVRFSLVGNNKKFRYAKE